MIESTENNFQVSRQAVKSYVFFYYNCNVHCCCVTSRFLSVNLHLSLLLPVAHLQQCCIFICWQSISTFCGPVQSRITRASIVTFNSISSTPHPPQIQHGEDVKCTKSSLSRFESCCCSPQITANFVLSRARCAN